MQRAQLFIGRLPRETRRGDLEDVFKRYGRVTRCDVRMGSATAYAFVDFDDHRDAEDALKSENGRDWRGQRMVVEWAVDDAKYGRAGGRRGGNDRGGRYGDRGYGNRGGRDDNRRNRSRSRSASPIERRVERRRRSPSRSRSRSPFDNVKKEEKSPHQDRSRSRSLSRSNSK